MKQITITVPDNCELKQDGNVYTIIEKEKKLTYCDIARELFKDGKAYYICSSGIIATANCFPNNSVNCTSEKQAQKLLAINELMNVAKYLNDDWQPNWKDRNEGKYCIYINKIKNKFCIDCYSRFQDNNILFKSEELAKKAIEILGEETIKLALCTDY